MCRLKFVCFGPCEGPDIICDPVVYGYDAKDFDDERDIWEEIQSGPPECRPNWDRISLLAVRRFIECIK